MNESVESTQPGQPTGITPTQQIPTTQPTPTTQPVTAPSAGSKALAIWALVLAILGILTALLVFISIPLAIAALVLAIMVLLKHRAGKGMAIAGLVIAGLTLLLSPLFITLSIVAYNGVSEKANQQYQESPQN